MPSHYTSIYKSFRHLLKQSDAWPNMFHVFISFLLIVEQGPKLVSRIWKEFGTAKVAPSSNLTVRHSVYVWGACCPTLLSMFITPLHLEDSPVHNSLTSAAPTVFNALNNLLTTNSYFLPQMNKKSVTSVMSVFWWATCFRNQTLQHQTLKPNSPQTTALTFLTTNPLSSPHTRTRTRTRSAPPTHFPASSHRKPHFPEQI